MAWPPNEVELAAIVAVLQHDCRDIHIGVDVANDFAIAFDDLCEKRFANSVVQLLGDAPEPRPLMQMMQAHKSS